MNKCILFLSDEKTALYKKGRSVEGRPFKCESNLGSSSSLNRRQFIYILFIGFFLSISAEIASAQFVPEWPICIDGCTANDVNLYAYLDIDPATPCTIGQEIQVPLKLKVLNVGGAKYCFVFKGDLYVNGVYSQTVIGHSEVITDANDNFIVEIVPYECGTVLELRNSYYAWTVSGHYDGHCEWDCTDYKASNPNNPKCAYPVPITVVLPYPSIAVEKQVKVGASGTWMDADTLAEGPSVLPATPLYFRFTVTNNGNVPLTSVALVDNSYAIAAPCTIPTTFPVGASFTCMTDAISAIEGDHVNTATASGQYCPSGKPCQGVTATDPAYYKCCPPPNAGPDQIICAGESIYLEASTTCVDSVAWSIYSCEGAANCGTLEPYGDPSDSSKKIYTPPPGVTKATLRLTRTLGALTDHDDRIVYVVPEPQPIITVLATYGLFKTTGGI